MNDFFTSADSDFFFEQQSELWLPDCVIFLLFRKEGAAKVEARIFLFLKENINVISRKRRRKQIVCFDEGELLSFFIVAEDEFVVIEDLFNVRQWNKTVFNLFYVAAGGYGWIGYSSI